MIDRDSIRGWQQSGSKDTFTRARETANQLVEKYQIPPMDEQMKKELVSMVGNLAKQAGMDQLPDLE